MRVIKDRIKLFFKSKNKARISILENDVKCLKCQLSDLRKEIFFSRKDIQDREYKLFKPPQFISFGGAAGPESEQSAEEKREKLRRDGFSFCHKMPDGEEIWSKC